ncbi:MAG: sn-glycerol-3-phosphate ABC transporter ATP-binding protein UgpC [Roseitalea sp.]|jgi:lactose/L-arabinose transport system ATP-binding protein|nr:sn-glycerol-3-phosphate ABC transporter ATP-binding protein UgpC [Roseitalea sp.]MBO6721483.1 sn-glycerol-3-phosphate ABC transporter ATP-binding protein UgpC [Roseitalea sp.]MBO6742040.1 sn-glycerol-3-phosphate ABC transporter ATP-binding protein UgpC [Roseitalea sp.]
MADVHLKNVKKNYGVVEVIHGIDLEVKDHEFVVFVGPSGCGKSTLLRMIAGLETTNSGSIHIGDRDVTDMAPVDRNVSMVFQSYALYPHMTVEDNMGFGLKANGVDPAEVKRLVDEAAQSLQLEAFMKRKPAALSGGQRQRVAIGRAIVRDPEVFLFDEPLSNLDAELRVHMRIEIARLHKRLKSTMIYVTHDQVEAMTLADKIVVLQGGRIEQVGTPLDLFDDPDNRFVAGFIGSPKMNFLPAIVAGIAADGVTVTLPSMNDTPVRTAVPGDHVETGQTVTLGVRPEHFTFRKGTGSPITVDCDVTEQMGEISYIYANTGDGAQIIVEQRHDRSTKDGDRVQTFIPPDKTFLFDAEGRRIR